MSGKSSNDKWQDKRQKTAQRNGSRDQAVQLQEQPKVQKKAKKVKANTLFCRIFSIPLLHCYFSQRQKKANCIISCLECGKIRQCESTRLSH